MTNKKGQLLKEEITFIGCEISFATSTHLKKGAQFAFASTNCRSTHNSNLKALATQSSENSLNTLS